MLIEQLTAVDWKPYTAIIRDQNILTTFMISHVTLISYDPDLYYHLMYYLIQSDRAHTITETSFSDSRDRIAKLKKDLSEVKQ